MKDSHKYLMIQCFGSLKQNVLGITKCLGVDGAISKAAGAYPDVHSE